LIATTSKEDARKTDVMLVNSAGAVVTAIPQGNCQSENPSEASILKRS